MENTTLTQEQYLIEKYGRDFMTEISFLIDMYKVEGRQNLFIPTSVLETVLRGYGVVKKTTKFITANTVWYMTSYRNTYKRVKSDDLVIEYVEDRLLRGDVFKKYTMNTYNGRGQNILSLEFDHDALKEELELT